MVDGTMVENILVAVMCLIAAGAVVFALRAEKDDREDKDKKASNHKETENDKE